MYKDRRLPNVIKTLPGSIPLNCVIVCLETNGCYAVNVGVANGEAVCELTGGLSNEDEMQSDGGSFLYVLGKWLDVKYIIHSVDYAFNRNSACSILLYIGFFFLQLPNSDPFLNAKVK